MVKISAPVRKKRFVKALNQEKSVRSLECGRRDFCWRVLPVIRSALILKRRSKERNVEEAKKYFVRCAKASTPAALQSSVRQGEIPQLKCAARFE
jgi:hypothetical protein